MASYLFPLVVLVLVQTSLAVQPCRVHPQFWCDDLKTAKECGVEEQCKSFAVSNAKKVEVAIYYESLCPPCRDMFQDPLVNAVRNINDIMNVTLVPYGNTKQKFNGTEWVFTCQHGDDECYGDLVQACALKYIKDFQIMFGYIYCMMQDPDHPPKTARPCGMTSQTIDIDSILKCASSKEGNTLVHQMGVKTEALNPPHQYTPWVTINGVHTDKMNLEAALDLIKLVCKTYTGSPKPAACTGP